MGTLQTLVRRAHDICSTNKHSQNELCHIKKAFHEQNQYPFWSINKVFCEIKRKNHQQLQQQQQQLPTKSSHEEVPNSKKHFLLLPHKGKKG